MDFLRQLDAFYGRMEYREPLTSSAIALYSALLQVDRKLGWRETFTASNKTLEVLSGLSGMSLHRAKNELARNGLLIYKGGKNRYKASWYSLPVLYDTESGDENGENIVASHIDTVNDMVNDMVDDTVNGTVDGMVNGMVKKPAPGTAGDAYIKNNINNKKNNKNINFSHVSHVSQSLDLDLKPDGQKPDGRDGQDGQSPDGPYLDKADNNQRIVESAGAIVSDVPDDAEMSRKIEDYREAVKANIEYDGLINIYRHKTDLVDEIVGIIVDTNFTERAYFTINRSFKPKALVIDQLSKLTYSNVELAIDQFLAVDAPIKNKKGYILTTLYNSVMETEAHYSNLYESNKYK